MMRRNKGKRIIFYILALSLILATVMLILYKRADKPPVEELESCRLALSHAKTADAERYAPDLYNIAKKNWDDIFIEWKKQNEKWFVQRDFNEMRSLVALTAQKAEEAENQAVKAKKSTTGQLQVELQETLLIIRKFEAYLTVLPLDNNIREDFTAGKMLVSEGQNASERGDMQKALGKISSGKKLIQRANQSVMQMLEDYFKNYSLWQKWVQQTIDYSRANKRTAILIDKLSQKCLVYKNGKIKYEFPVEMGKNWLGTKRQKGDKATPEGKYHITSKKSGNGTKYYKALLISYPNEDDKKRFSNEKKNGTLPPDSQIGNLIEIHGDGGKGIHWTDGCVALVNGDMDKLYPIVIIGTPVTIVGSVRKLTDIFQN